jgi:phage replication O-like protein O
MANPQRENGHTRIANEILEALARTRLNDESRRVLDVILRKTYGFNKKQDAISLSQFVLATSLMKSCVCRAVKRLINMNIIIKIANGDITMYQFNKDFDTWKSLAKLLTLAKPLMTISETANKPLAKQRHTKETITKDNITKEITTKVVRAKAQPREDINILLNGIRQLVGVIDGSQQEQRNFAKNFLDSKTPEILRRAGNLNPTTQQIINATLRIFQLATKDDFHRKNCNSIRYVYNKAAAIALSGKNNQPKIIKV